MSGAPPKFVASKISRGVVACGKESAVYGLCLVENINNLQTGICKDSFTEFKKCFTEHLKKDRRRR